jgi:hypothetical protein
LAWPHQVAATRPAERGHVVPASLLPFSRSQVQMALEDNTGYFATLQRDLGWAPRGFENTVRKLSSGCR